MDINESTIPQSFLVLHHRQSLILELFDLLMQHFSLNSMPRQYAEGNSRPNSSHTINHNILLAPHFLNSLLKFTQRNGNSSVYNTHADPLRFASYVEVSPVFYCV